LQALFYKKTTKSKKIFGQYLAVATRMAESRKIPYLLHPTMAA
jgi:hypothetical protein